MLRTLRSTLVVCSLIFGLAFLVASTANGQDEVARGWPSRHGPYANGSANPEDAKGLPTEWDEAEGKNIAWKIEVPGKGHSTPVIGNGKVWLTTATPDGTKQWLIAYDEESGEELHKILLFENAEPEPLGNDVNTYASPTCVLDKGSIYAHFGTYGTAKLNAKSAEIEWVRRDINARHFRGPGSSPIIHGKYLVLTFDGIDKQFLTALNKETGTTLWTTNRTTDYGDLDQNGEPFREGDLRKAYSTPGVVEVNGRWQVVSVGSRAAFGYDLETGKEIWTVRHSQFNAAAPPVFFNGHAILNTGSRDAHLMAVKLDDTTTGDITESHLSYDLDRSNSRLAAPLLLDGRIYMITDRGVVKCVDAKTGEELWIDRVSGNYVSSPVAANGYVFFCSEEGVTSLVKAGDKFELVQRNELQEGMRASPAISNGAIFLRTFGHLYKIKAQ